MTVGQISDETEVPVSTAYKKIERLQDASLLIEEIESRLGGHHRWRYLADSDRIVVALDDRREFMVDVENELDDPELDAVDRGFSTYSSME